MAVAFGVWAGRGVAATSMAATRVRVRDGVLQNLIGSLLAIAYDRIKAIIPLKPKCGLNGAPSFCCAERS
jgi:hypothetical protein